MSESKLTLAQRIHEITPSQTIHFFNVMTEMIENGEKVLSLLAGEPDFPSSEAIKDATAKALKENQTGYSAVLGISSLKAAILKKTLSANNIKAESSHIGISNGSKHSLYNLFQIILNPGDEIIIPVPYWVTFPENVKLAGGVPKFVDTDPSTFSIRLDKIEAALTPKTRAIIINSPNNPSGAVYSKDELTALYRLAVKHNLYLISDEAYEHYTFSGLEHFSPGSLEELPKHVITVQTFSKSFAMTGYRVGYTIASKEITAAMAKFQGHLTGNVCTFAQYGALKALEEDQTQKKKNQDLFEKRRNFTYELLKDVFPCHLPQGAFYFFVDASKYIGEAHKNSLELALYILKEAKVGVAPGSAFGLENHLRLSFSRSETEIAQALAQIKDLLCK